VIGRASSLVLQARSVHCDPSHICSKALAEKSGRLGHERSEIWT
jgi:hypothetical protein